MSAHTPGPLVIGNHQDANKAVLLSVETGKWVAVIQQNGEHLLEVQDANMRLWAAAPDLLAALVSAMSHIPNPDDVEDGRAGSLDDYGKFWCREMHKVYRAAIAKVEGRA